MKIIDQLRNEDGFTIQEILVVLIVGSILVSLSLSLFQFTNELFQTWYGTNELKSDMNRILNTMALDIQRASGVVERTNSTLILSRGVGRTVKYSFDDHSLRRNNVDLTPQKIKSFLVNLEDVPGKDRRAKSFHIKLFAQSKWTSYETEIVAMTSQCSKAGF
jgi:competence protein ComGC